MRKSLLIAGIIILIFTGYVYALDGPHNESNEISCFDCHLGGQATVNPNTVCLGCHTNASPPYSKSGAPLVSTHSGSTHGTFEKQCTDCHYFHFYNQHYMWQSDTYLITGTITSITDNGDGTITFGYSNLVVNSNNWSSPGSWVQKSGSERGLIMLPNTKDLSFGYEVINADTTTITVKGSIAPYQTRIHVGDTFALIYGQAINSFIPDWTQPRVKFYEKEGINGFAHNDLLAGDIDGDGNLDDSTPSGVCQVCHVLTNYWRKDGTLAATGVHSSQNGTDCTTCHPHKEGFRVSASSCSACHGYPPTSNTYTGGPSGLASPATGSDSAGKHDLHANYYGFKCNTCHTGYTMPDNTNHAIEIGFSIFGNTGGSYDGQTAVNYVGTNGTTVSNTGTRTCSSIYCHSNIQGQTDGTGGPTAFGSPTWLETATVQCGDCHNADGVQGNGTIMSSGSHTKHVNKSTYAFACSKCHNNAGASNTTVHVNYVINISFDTQNPNGSYNGSNTSPGNHAPGLGYGSCSNLYCHSQGNPNTTPNVTPTWGASFPTDCTGCHNNDSAAAPNTMSTGGHTAHVNKGTIMSNATCDSCHTSTVSGNRTIIGFNLHVNGVKDVTINANYDGDSIPDNNYSNGSCSNIYCHSDATSLTGPYNPPNTVATWGSTTGLGCSDCHTGPPTGPDYTNGNPKANSHNAHVVVNGFTCDYCHNATVTYDTVNNTYSISTPANHLNKQYDVSGTYIVGGYTYSPGGGTCSNITCHGGQNAQWGTTLTCSSCHTNDMGMNATVRRGIYKTGNDFTKTSHHIAGTPDDNSCKVCHNRSNHTREGDPNVRLFNEDTGADVVYDGTGASLEAFCVSCHDSDGASRLGTNALQPFVDSLDNNPPPNINWNSAAAAHSALTDKCFGCHGNSGAAGNTLDPVINAHGSDSPKLLRYTGWLATDESGFCFNCHGSPTANGATDDLQTVFNLASKHGDKNCAACHNKHELQPGLHVKQSGNIAPVNYGTAVLDVAAVTWPAAWSATDFSTTAKKSATSTDEEWQLCLKCHNGGGPALTDIALEFNPNNASYHSVVQLNPNRNTKPAGNASGEGGPAFVAPWSANSRMTCTDCHTNSDSTQAQGPHGSAVAFLLVAPYDSTTGEAGTQNHLCFRCHDWEGYVNNNQDCKNDPCQYHTGFSLDTETDQRRKEFNLHAYHNRKGYTCRNCHLARPHGAQGGPNNITRALLLWQGDTTPAPYRQAGAVANEWLYIITWQSSPGNWNQNNCAINTAGGGH